MSILLTDDEVLYVALRGGSDWPAVLPSVVAHTQPQYAAALRGMRSLLVRDLITVEGDQVSVDPELESQVRTCTHAAASVCLHPTSLDHIGRFWGEGRVVALDAFGGATVDIVSAAGVHRFIDYEADVALATTESVLTVFRTPKPDSGKGGLLVYPRIADGGEALWCAPGRVVEGLLTRNSERGTLSLESQQPADAERAAELIRKWVE